MRIKTNATSMIYILSVLFSSQSFSATSNPASTNYVNKAISAQTLTAGDGISISNHVITAVPQLKIGDLYQGAVVFYVDRNGKGLSVALKDSTNAPYFYDITTVLQTSGPGLGSGSIATAVLRASSNGSAIIAATVMMALAVTENGLTVCDGSPTPCYGGFYLGSIAEMTLLYNQLSAVNTALSSYGGDEIAKELYWTTTPFSQETAHAISMINGGLAIPTRTDVEFVRGIQSF